MLSDRAFADPAKKRRWFAEGLSHTLENFALDLRVDKLGDLLAEDDES